MMFQQWLTILIASTSILCGSLAQADRQVCDKCDSFHQFDLKTLKPFSLDMQKATNLMYDFKFSSNRSTRQAQIKEYILLAVPLMKIDQLALVQDYANQMYRRYKSDFDFVLNNTLGSANERKVFLEEVQHAEERHQNGDDDP